MNGRNPRTATPRSSSALVHRGPQAMTQTLGLPFHAPNAALLIDFDNVTMGIRSDLGKELRNLLGSEIIKGKVAVQRAYADWRRYPQYIVPLSEASIDLIFAPAYGSSKKNATDIRLAIDALELVFTRPEIGTFILLSGDSDFSSLVIKLKEYGKYVIGVGIRESSSDLLVQNCDEYYSYNALAGLVKANEDEPARKWDPWELVTEAVGRMKRNGDVMRSDRLKQVMQELDPDFDEKNLGMSKFSRFVQEASQRGLITVTKLENGQLEIDAPESAPERAPAEQEAAPAAPRGEEREPREGREERGGRRGRRGRRGRGDRDREERGPRPEREESVAAAAPAGAEDEAPREDAAPREARPRHSERPPREERRPADVPAQLELAAEPRGGESIGLAGERLTRNEAFDLVRRAVAAAATDERPARASDLRRAARELLGRDSESLSERMFVRILKDAHDAGIVDLRRRGDDFEVAPTVDAESVADQLARAEEAHRPAPPPAPAAGTPRLGMGPRGAGARGRGRGPAAIPAELLAVGVISQEAPAPVAPSAPAEAERAAADTPAPAAGRKRGGRKTAVKSPAKAAKRATKTGTRGAKTAATAPEAAPPEPPAASRGRSGGRKTTPRGTRVVKKAAAGAEGQE